jgi:diaminopimelate decarboxylase
MPRRLPFYREVVAQDPLLPGLWDYLRYDDDGQLWLNDLCLVDAARRYGTPLEIVDTTLVERRCREFRALAHAAAEAAGYPGRLSFLYAAKANMASEMVAAAYRSGWQAETSAVQDLHNLTWLKRHDLLPPNLRVVCNGFKLPPSSWGYPHADLPVDGRPVLPEPPARAGRTPISYAEQILAMAANGWDITPILDAGELPYFDRQASVPLKVGLRLKFGHVESLGELDPWVSRFGQDLAGVQSSAAAIAASERLTLTTLHAMVGAAETIPVAQLVNGIGVAAQVWATLKQEHPTLSELNMGGGLPPLAEAYDHRGFLSALFAKLLDVTAAAGVPAPDFTFELGSLVAAEAGFHVFKVLQFKRNHRAGKGEPTWWAILDGGLMAAIPDMLFLGKPFRFLAITGADRPARHVRLGDVTCDSDGRYPPKAFGPTAGVPLPAWAGPNAGEQYLLIPCVGAYQEVLAGVRGAHHCGLLEAVELILERGPDGQQRGRLMARQTFQETAALLGYHSDAVSGLADALAAAQSELG